MQRRPGEGTTEANVSTNFIIFAMKTDTGDTSSQLCGKSPASYLTLLKKCFVTKNKKKILSLRLPYGNGRPGFIPSPIQQTRCRIFSINEFTKSLRVSTQGTHGVQFPDFAVAKVCIFIPTHMSQEIWVGPNAWPSVLGLGGQVWPLALKKKHLSCTNKDMIERTHQQMSLLQSPWVSNIKCLLLWFC